MVTRNFHDVCILQTKFGLKQYLWARWIATDVAQVHDGERAIAQMIQWSPHRVDEWQVQVFDQSKPNNRWTAEYTSYRNTREDLAWARLVRESIKAWKAANPGIDA